LPSRRSWRAPPTSQLTIDVRAEKPNELAIVLTENTFRAYRGKQKDFVAIVKLSGGPEAQPVSLEPKDFRALDGEALASWKNVDLLSLRAYYESLGSKSWAGSQPTFRKLWWQGRDQ
jgi:hypothetical protein